MSVDIVLPRLVGTRASAHAIVQQALRRSQRPTSVTLYARAVLNAAPSFVDELVKLLIEKRVASLDLIGESSELRQQIVEANTRHGSALAVTSSEPIVHA
jgi:hypothetical protein